MPRTANVHKPPTPRRERGRRIVRVSEAAEMLGRSPTTIRRWCDEGLLPHGIIKGQREIRVTDIERLIERAMKGKL